MAQNNTKVYGRSHKQHGVPAVKVTKNNSGGRETSAHVQAGLKAKHGWNDRGMPKSSKPSVPGYNYPSGTPKYIQQAASAAEQKASRIVRDFGGGVPDSARHRVPAPYSGKGAPDVKQDQSYRNPVKETK